MDIKSDSKRLIEAFDHMVENVSQTIHEAEEALQPTIDEMVLNAQSLAHDLHQLSQEEAERLGKALKRDIHSANKILNQQGKELKDWLSFDLTLIEDKFIDLIARAADKTWLDFRSFEYENKVKDILVTEDQKNHFTSGHLAIVVTDTTKGSQFEIVAVQIAQKIAERDEQSVILLNDRDASAAPKDDLYAAYQIPDDLTW